MHYNLNGGLKIDVNSLVLFVPVLLVVYVIPGFSTAANLLVALFFVTLYLLKKINRIVLTPYFIFILFVFFAITSLFWSASYKTAIGNSIQLITYSLLGLAVSIYCKDSFGRYRFFKGLFYIFLVLVIVGVIEAAVKGVNPLYSRFAPLAINVNTYSLFMVFWLVSLFYLLWSEQTTIYFKVFIWLLFLVAVLNILLFTGSRKGFFALVIVVFVFLFYYYRLVNLSKKILFTIIFTISFIVTAYLFVQTVHFERILLIAEIFSEEVSDSSINQRSGMMSKGIELFKEKPVFGWGLYQFRYVSGLDRYSHSNVIEVLVNHGVFGFLLYKLPFLVFFFIYFIKRKFLHVKDRFAFWSLFLVTIAWNFGAVTYVANGITWIILGVLASISSSKIDKRTSRSKIFNLKVDNL